MSEEIISTSTEVVETAPVNVDDIATDLTDTESPTSVETVETNETPELDEGIPAQEEEGVNDDKEFIADEIDFEEGKYKVEGYNLDKYSEIFDFEDENSIKAINAEMLKLKEKGYTQKEAEIYIGAKIELMEEYEADIKPLPTTREEVLKVLNESLTREEKANYKPILNWTREVGESIGLTPAQINEAMSNPQLVKLMNGFYKKAVNKGGVKTSEVKAPENKISLDYASAMKSIQDKIAKGSSKEDVIKYAKELESSITGDQLEQFQTTYKRVFGIK